MWKRLSEHRILPPVGSALLLALAFPPFNGVLLVFVALVPWFRQLSVSTPKQARQSGFVFGITYWLIHLYFLVPFVSRWTGSFWVGTIPWMILALYMSLYGVLVGVCIQQAYKLNRPWAIPFIWGAVEFCHSYIPTIAFPFASIAQPLWRIPMLAQHAAYGTVFLVAGGVALSNVALALAHEKNGWTRARPYLIAGSALLLASLQRYYSPPVGVPTTLSAGQIGVDMAFSSPEAQRNAIDQAAPKLIGLARDAGSQLLVLPEGLCRTGPINQAPSWKMDPKVPTIFGSQQSNDGPIYQAAIGFDGSYTRAYKTRLVAFGEFVPFRNQLPFLASFNLPNGDMQAGSEVKLLTIGGLKVGPMICFEALFPDLADQQCRNGAQVLAVLSIDDWYMASSTPETLLGESVWRSIESGLPLVRAASLGLSAVVDGRGNLARIAPVGRQTLATAQVTVPAGSDAFSGKWLIPWAMVVASILSLFPSSKRGSSRTSRTA